MRFIINKVDKNIIFYYKHKYINNKINYKSLRLIDESGKQIGILSLKESIELSIDKKLDLIIINNNILPPVCKILDYNKYKYKKNKFIKNQKRKKKYFQVKEIQISQSIEKEDFKIKLNKIQKLLLKNFKIKIILKFKGREIIHSKIGFNLLEKIIYDTKNISKIEFISNKIENRQIILILIKNKKI